MSSEMWQQVIDAYPVDGQRALYKRVLKTRRRAVPVSLNGRTQLVRRAVVRDYLASKVGNTDAK